MKITIDFINEWTNDKIEVLDTNGFEWVCNDTETIQYMLDNVLGGTDKYVIHALGYDGWVKENNVGACESLSELLNDYSESKNLFNHG